MLIALAVAGSLIGIAIAYAIYVRKQVDPELVELDVFAKGWYIDSSYAAFMGGPGRKAFDAIAWFDRTIIDGAVNGTAALVAYGGSRLRRIQTGKVGNYALGVAAGVVVMLIYVVTRMSY